MKMRILILLILITFQFQAQYISPYFKVADIRESMTVAQLKVNNTLKSKGFIILGSYHPGNNPDLTVIAFTRPDLKHTVVQVTDRGALSTAMRVGLVKKGTKIIISYTNPEYIFRAYLQNDYSKYENFLRKFTNDVKQAFLSIGHDLTPFGGKIKKSDIKDYHYKIMMPYFTDPVELKEFNSFAEGVEKIENNLYNHTANTHLVYKIKFKNKKVAVYGVALLDKNDGEAYFLPKIGIDNVAAMPYEIILQDKKATMLHGKYRLALFWPNLSMGDFMKIISTPKDIENILKKLCQ